MTIFWHYALTGLYKRIISNLNYDPLRFSFLFFSQITFWQILWRVYFQIVYREQRHLFLLSCVYDYSFRDLVSLVINSLNYIMQFICVVLSMINVIKFFPTKQPRYMTLQLRLNYCLSKSSCYVNIYIWEVLALFYHF